MSRHTLLVYSSARGAMSDRMTNIEIEDVLSSIRRLVSDDLRPVTPNFVSTRKPEADKLLLTPALRVEAPAEHAAPPARITLMQLHSDASIGAEESTQAEEVPEAPHTFAGDDWQEDWEVTATLDLLQPEPEPELKTGDEPVEVASLDQPAAFDEQMLRDMVREIIREELQGPLGERITRNVRKLVRAEINRARTSRDIG